MGRATNAAQTARRKQLQTIVTHAALSMYVCVCVHRSHLGEGGLELVDFAVLVLILLALARESIFVPLFLKTNFWVQHE